MITVLDQMEQSVSSMGHLSGQDTSGDLKQNEAAVVSSPAACRPTAVVIGP